MKKNMGNTDKAIRTLIALIIAALSYFEFITGILGNVLLVLAIILLITSLINFCPLYKLLGINTCKTKN
ncbi:YgaP family membrane protein [Tenacibaculum sp. SDUM215027]|uniref:YgaP family membrane protein n=1 Tax=Tenacibaculum sp. SDUM215027 TaxID=3422596 RepID=UPI003D3188D7